MSGIPIRSVLHESGCLGMQPKMGGKFHLKLNIGTRPIANKYREGKMKSTLKRELKGREAVKMEPFEASNGTVIFSLFPHDSCHAFRTVQSVRGLDRWGCVRDVFFIVPCQHGFDQRKRRIDGR